MVPENTIDTTDDPTVLQSTKAAIRTLAPSIEYSDRTTLSIPSYIYTSLSRIGLKLRVRRSRTMIMYCPCRNLDLPVSRIIAILINAVCRRQTALMRYNLLEIYTRGMEPWTRYEGCMEVYVQEFRCALANRIDLLFRIHGITHVSPF